ncbi:MAG TPA: hypothetical protein VIA62_27935 [Thermoanaerobaculia bacterium]|jgi:hypothetical protein|nr:hypothetical protein [Thermoanaerobaculia bacterium]
MADDRLKYFDLLQAAITRMASNSFLLKGWNVTLVAALLGVAAREGKPEMALVALVPVSALWGLDAYYLALERRFRELWKNAIAAATPTFNMNPGAVSIADWLEAAWRPAVWGLHLPLAIACFVAYIWLAKKI